MREGTSGFWIEKKRGAISIGYADYGVSEFGGGDFERTYYLNKENSRRLVAALRREHRGSLEKMLEEAFGRSFNDSAFWDFCKREGIDYSTSTWSG